MEKAFEGKGFEGRFLGRSPQTMDVGLGSAAALLSLHGTLGDQMH